MKAIQLNALGSVDNFSVVEVPTPELGEDEVLIKNRFAGIMYADIMQRKGGYLFQPPLPFIPGKEVSGVVEKVGPNVKDIAPGMRVMTTVLVGGYAEYVKAFERDIIVLPDNASFEQGLVYLVNLPVAYLAYAVFGKVQPGETILLHAAAGGVGTMITQIAKRKGQNTVIALSSSNEKLDYCKKNGADHGVNYKAADYWDEVLKLTNNQGVDISFNSVSGATLQTDPLCIKYRGRWVIYGYSGGAGTIDPLGEQIIIKSLNITSFTTYSVFGTEEQINMYRFLRNWLATESLESPTKIFKLEDIGEAHTWMESQRSFGKIVLEM